MRGGRTQPKKVAKSTYNRYRAERTQIQPYSEFLQQHGYEPQTGELTREGHQSSHQPIHRDNRGEPRSSGEGETTCDSDSSSGKGGNDLEDEHGIHRSLDPAQSDSPGNQLDDMYETIEEANTRLEQERLAAELLAGEDDIPRNNNLNHAGGPGVSQSLSYCLR